MSTSRPPLLVETGAAAMLSPKNEEALVGTAAGLSIRPRRSAEPELDEAAMVGMLLAKMGLGTDDAPDAADYKANRNWKSDWHSK